jgi:hypothetical protein
MCEFRFMSVFYDFRVAAFCAPPDFCGLDGVVKFYRNVFGDVQLLARQRFVVVLYFWVGGTPNGLCSGGHCCIEVPAKYLW